MATPFAEKVFLPAHAKLRRNTGPALISYIRIEQDRNLMQYYRSFVATVMIMISINCSGKTSAVTTIYKLF